MTSIQGTRIKGPSEWSQPWLQPNHLGCFTKSSYLGPNPGRWHPILWGYGLGSELCPQPPEVTLILIHSPLLIHWPKWLQIRDDGIRPQVPLLRASHPSSVPVSPARLPAGLSSSLWAVIASRISSPPLLILDQGVGAAGGANHGGGGSSESCVGHTLSHVGELGEGRPAPSLRMLWGRVHGCVNQVKNFVRAS